MTSLITYGMSGLKRTSSPLNSNVDTRTQTVVCTGNKSGTSDKDWRTKIVKQQDVSHQYERYECNRYKSGWFYHQLRYQYTDKKWYPYNVMQRITPRVMPYTVGSIPNLPSLATTRDIALKRLKNKLNGDTAQFQALVPLAELRELRGTLRGIAYSASNMLKSMIALKHGNFKDAHKRASDVWLTFSFGVNPMLSDAQSIAEALAAYLELYRTVRYTGTASTTWVVDNPVISVGTDYFGTCDTKGYYQCEYKAKYIAAYKFLMLAGNNYGYLDQFGLKAENLPSVFWELTPYSWVVDYFTTAGAYLEDVFYTNPGQTLYVIQNEKFTSKFICDMSSSLVKSAFYPSQEELRITSKPEVEYFHFRRLPLAQLPRRQLRFKTVDEIGANWINRVLNLASLLRFGRPTNRSKIPIF